jgi:chain length determinant protein tyrosine kinase EpsG
MNSQVHPLPNRAEGEFSLAHRGDIDLHIAPGAPPRPIGQMLVESGRLAPEDVELILQRQAHTRLPFGETAITLGLLAPEDLQDVLAEQFGATALTGHPELQPELVAATEPDSPAVEHLRAVRSQLMLRWFENDDRQAGLAVVSPGNGDGRSWIAANLAVLFSQLGKRTVLVDADLRRPRQHRIFGMAGRIGLSAVLAGRTGWDAVKPVRALPGLWLLPAGAVPPNPQELLGRPGLPRLIEGLHARYEVVLIDTPAAETCADANMIAARAGGALMVACRDQSSMRRLTSLADNLREFGVTVVGAVLNGVR